MEHILRALGTIGIVVGFILTVYVAVQLRRAGVPVQTMLVTQAFIGGIGVVVSGVLLLGFGSVIALLRAIKRNTDG
jgi:hypothetical protein